MSRYHSYLSTAERILRNYAGEVPLSIYLKEFFSENRQMGGRDRKMVSHLCYQYFRLGHYGKDLPVFEKIVLAAMVNENANQEFLEAVAPAQIREDGRVKELQENVHWQQVFPFANLLSKRISREGFAKSMMQQPFLFLRMRPGFEKQLLELFNEQAIPYELVDTHCLQLTNGISLNNLEKLDHWMVVQDRSSQQTGNVIFKSQNFADHNKLQVWDCCAASGGKSMMLADLFEHISLTVSDIRESILQNLKQRFRTAGIKHYTSFISDLSRKQKDVPNAPFDMIVADVPCTGSGTWARTPEQLFFFQEKSLKSFADRQYAIVSNCLQWLKPNGHLVYITCSVFAAENEEVVQQLVENNMLILVHDEYITGYLHGADSMYIAILKRR